MTTTCVETFDTPARGTIGSALRAALDKLIAYRKVRREQRDARDAFLNLLTLDDRLIEDAGLTRYDVERAARLPLHVDAAEILQTWRKDARLRD